MRCSGIVEYTQDNPYFNRKHKKRKQKNSSTVDAAVSLCNAFLIPIFYETDITL